MLKVLQKYFDFGAPLITPQVWHSNEKWQRSDASQHHKGKENTEFDPGIESESFSTRQFILRVTAELVPDTDWTRRVDFKENKTHFCSIYHFLLLFLLHDQAVLYQNQPLHQ